ncbi:hypothetical protein QUG92_11620 [Curtobacterium sp. RHCKG23]|uniref:Bacterial Ig domain-containing protein n=1 Tax=Curtobacterium citri TaxID=3055139 RepID=A0ABT7T8R8_9MICO|nr:hypothetical protein [Curtobacterium citri]MDM7885754.1 hypothetical protein [Curtobacterium citri]
MKKTLRAVGAAGLAATTIVTGLSFGPAAATAAEEAGSETRQLVLHAGGKYWSTGPADSASLVPITAHATREAAEAAAQWWDIPVRSGGKLRLTGTDSCLTDMLNYELKLRPCSTAQSWKITTDGELARVDNNQRVRVDASTSRLRIGSSLPQSPVTLDVGSDLVREGGRLVRGRTSDWILLAPSSGDYQGNGYLTVPAGMRIIDAEGRTYNGQFGGVRVPYNHTISEDGRTVRQWRDGNSSGDNLHWGPGSSPWAAIAVKVAVDEDFAGSTADFGLTVQRVLADQRITYSRSTAVPIEGMTASGRYDQATDAVTLSIKGSANESVIIADQDGKHGKTYQIGSSGTLDQVLPDDVGWGERVQVSFGGSQPIDVATSRTAAITDIEIDWNETADLVFSGTAVRSGANVYVSPSRYADDAVQVIKAGSDGKFSAELNADASKLRDAFVFQYVQGVRTPVTVDNRPERLNDVRIVKVDSKGVTLEADLPDDGDRKHAAFAYEDYTRTPLQRPESERNSDSVGWSTDAVGATTVQVPIEWAALALVPGASRTVAVQTGAFDGRSWVNSASSLNIVVTRPYDLAASAHYDSGSDSFTLSGTTFGDKAIVQVSADNGATWKNVAQATGNKYEVRLDRRLTAGTSLRVRELYSERSVTVPLHEAALSDVAVGKTGSKRTLTAKAGSPNAVVHVSSGDTKDGDYQTLTAGADGWIRGVVLDEVPADVTSATIWGGDRGQRTTVNLPLTFGANVGDVNVEKGTAFLYGFVPSDADRVEVQWGSETRNVTPQGEAFSVALDKLALGKNTVTVRAFAGKSPLGTTTVDVDLRVQDVTASAKFDEDPQTVVQLGGKATPHVKVEIRRGRETVKTVSVSADGTWTAGVNAPNMTGVDTLEIAQVIRGADNGVVELPVDYGVGTEITSPEDGAALEPGSTLDLEGKSQQGALVKVFEKGKPGSILGSAEASKQDGTWDIAVKDLEDREYQLVASTVSKGYNTTTTEITINPGKSAVAKPTAEASFLSDITKKAVVSGTGVNGGEITVKNKATGETIAGPVKVVDGKWSTEIDPIGAGSHELVIEQTGVDDGTQTAETTIDYGASVGITGPSGTVPPGMVTVSGTGQDGAEVTVQAGDEQVETTVSGTTWSADIEIPGGTSSVKITATQQSKGALSTSSSTEVVPNGSQEATAVAITEPTDGYYTPGEVTRIAGTATPYAQVTVRSDWDTLAPVMADRNGKWEVWGWFGPSSSYNLVASQERVDGSTSESAVFKLAPKGSSEHKEVAITTPSGFYSPGETTLVRGTATPFARVDISASFGYLDTVYADQNGDWAWWAHIGPSAIYELTATQTRGDGSTSKSNTIVLKPEADQSSPVVIDTPSGTYNPDGQTKISGTSSPNAVITLNASWGPLEPTVTADDNGSWTFWGDLGPSAEYILTARQERTDGTSSTSNTITLKPVVPADAPVVIDTPSGTYVPGAWTTISGTSAPGAEITISADWGPFGTTQADSRGKWSYSDNIGPSAVYNLTATQKRADGTFSDSNTITLSPAN